MYTGDQHRYVMDGISRIRRTLGREAVSLKIISAGYGLVDEVDLLLPYEATFKTRSRSQGRSWARKLEIADRSREILRAHRLCLFLLGDDYLTALEPPLRASSVQRLVFLTKSANAAKVTGTGVTVVPAGLGQTSLGAGLAALKGKMFQRFAAAVEKEGSALIKNVYTDPTPDSFMGAVLRGHV